MSDRELIEFTDNMITVNVVLDEEQIAALKADWSQVTGIQPPLVGTYKNGLSVFIPWILKEEDVNE